MGDILKLSASATACELCEWVQAGKDYISLIESIRSSLAHLHGFQLLVLLFIEITFFVCTKRMNFLRLK